MTSYQKLKQRVEELERDKTLLLKSIVYPEKIDCDDSCKLISMSFGFRLQNSMYNTLMGGDYSGEHPTGIINIK